jgi:ABC-type lipoprotein export system ATPase subunit
MALLELEEVSKSYRTDGVTVEALRGVSLEVDAGEFVALVGRSGCGKTTLLNLAGAMDQPTAGEVRIAGVSTRRLNDAALARLRRTRVGFVFQSFQLLGTLTAVENVELPLLVAGRADARRLALERLDWVGLGELAHRYPHQLSGGQMQRVAIARALAASPRLILADEPTGNLDSATAESIVALLARIASEQGAAVLMATHSQEAAAACHRLIRLRDGRIEAIEETGRR